MRRALRWLGYTLGGLLALVLVAAIVVYALSEHELRRTFAVDTRGSPPPPFVTPLPTDSASLAEGHRLATTRGCFDGCHGPGLSGGVFFDEPWVARLVAPDLTAAASRYSDAQLERIIRHGVRPNGRSVFGMPSGMFHRLSDADVARILAFIRSAPPSHGLEPAFAARPLGRLGIVLGEYQAEARRALGDTGRATSVAPAPADTLALGRYLAHTSCAECHGMDLQGSGRRTPALSLASAYTLDEFRHFFRTGTAKGGRELKLMSDMARQRFSHFTYGEVGALHAYLVTLGGTGSPSASARGMEAPRP